MLLDRWPSLVDCQVERGGGEGASLDSSGLQRTPVITTMAGIVSRIEHAQRTGQRVTPWSGVEWSGVEWSGVELS